MKNESQNSIKIASEDNKSIYGVLDKKNPQDFKLIIFVHGFTGSADEHHYLNAVPFFNSRGFATYRFNLYGSEPDARKTSKVSFTDHIKDTRRVIDHFSADFKEIYLVGHSLGGCVVSIVDKSNINKIVLWDPTNGFNSLIDRRMQWNNNLNAYICDSKMEVLFGKDLIEEWMNITIKKQIDSFKVPTKIIFAGNHDKYDQWKEYLGKIKIENDYVVIEGASHGFVEEGKSVELYEETYKWFSKLH